MINEWKNFSSQQYSPAERARHLLEVAINELKTTPRPNEDGAAGILPNVRYAIFNYVPWKHFESRTTVSYFNFRPNIIDKEPFRNEWISQMLEHKALYEYKKDDSHLIITDGSVYDFDNEAFQNIWSMHWQEYLSLTARDNGNTHLASWNDYLLNHSTFPINMGVVWNLMGVEEETIYGDYVIDKSYENISAITAYKTSLKEFISNGNLIINESIIDSVIALRELCHPKININRNDVADSLTSLYWGFGIWGADSFISIPVTYSSSSMGRTGVLSLGTIHPLSSEDITRWTLIANNVIGTLLNLESEDRILNSTTNYTYRVGHPFKNRSNSIACFSRRLIKNFDDLLRVHDHGDKKSTRIKLHQHKKDLKFIEKNSKRLTGFGSLVNFLSALSIENNVWSDDRAKRWLTEKPVKVSKLLTGLAEASFHRQNHNLKLNMIFTKNLNNQHFACQVKNNNPNLYLGEELLSAIFYELTVNAIQYGKACDEEIELQVSLFRDGQTTRLSLTNVVANDFAQEETQMVEYDIHGAGGETLAGHLFAELIKGGPKLKRKKYLRNSECYFQYQIELPIIGVQ